MVFFLFGTTLLLLLLSLFVELRVYTFVIEVSGLFMGKLCKLNRQYDTYRNYS